MLLRSAVFETEDPPAHPLWEGDEFEKEALDALFEIIKTDVKIEQNEALKLARKKRTEARTAKNEKRKELYDRIVFELTEASAREFEGLKKEVFGGVK